LIFLTVGNYNPFPRLVSALDGLKANGAIADDVLLQIANMPKFESQVCRVVRFLPPMDYQRCIHKASVIVCHAGAGNIADALRAGKLPVVMPRRKKYGEHVDDHQMELAEMLSKEGRIILASEPNDLLAAILEARSRGHPSIPSDPPRMVRLVSQVLEELSNCRTRVRP
jgi:UDP-N-acetylglucosamine transferase subunit ALG13